MSYLSLNKLSDEAWLLIMSIRERKRYEYIKYRSYGYKVNGTRLHTDKDCFEQCYNHILSYHEDFYHKFLSKDVIKSKRIVDKACCLTLGVQPYFDMYEKLASQIIVLNEWFSTVSGEHTVSHHNNDYEVFFDPYSFLYWDCIYARCRQGHTNHTDALDKLESETKIVEDHCRILFALSTVNTILVDFMKKRAQTCSQHSIHLAFQTCSRFLYKHTKNVHNKDIWNVSLSRNKYGYQMINITCKYNNEPFLDKYFDI